MFDPVSLQQQLASAHPSAASSTSGRDMAVRARTASRALQALPTSERVAMLDRVADALLARQSEILAANEKDMEEAQVRFGGGIGRVHFFRKGRALSPARPLGCPAI